MLDKLRLICTLIRIKELPALDDLLSIPALPNTGRKNELIALVCSILFMDIDEWGSGRKGGGLRTLSLLSHPSAGAAMLTRPLQSCVHYRKRQ